MAFTVPTQPQMRDMLLALFKTLFPDRAASPARFFGKLMAWVAGAVTDVHYHVRSVERDVMPDTTAGAMLDRWLWILAPGGRRTRKAATAARKGDALRVTGTVGATVAVGDTLRDPATGILYELTEAGTIPAGGYVDVSLAAVTLGSIGRVAAGTVLEFLAPPSGIATEAELQYAVDEDGADVELEASARARMLAALADPARGGSQADFVAWALAQDGIAAAYCYPNRAGLGSIDVVAYHAGQGGSRLLTSLERAELLTALQALVPVQLAGATGALRVLETTPDDLDVEIAIEADTWDWDDATPPTVTTWTAGTRTLDLSSRPASLVAGARVIIVPPSAAGTGEQVRVEALSGLTAVVLERAPTSTPTAGDLVYAGGPLVDPIRTALGAHLSGELVYAGTGIPIPASTAEASGESPTRLRILAEPLGPENAGRAYGAWSGAAVRSTLSRIATYAAGVVDCTVVLPATDADPTIYTVPDDDQVGHWFPRRLLVRRRH